MKKINERLTELRERAGLSSGKAANLCGWSAGRYSHLETGRNAISIEHAEVIAEAFKEYVGDQLIWLTTGRTIEEYIVDSGWSPEYGYMLKDDAVNVFKTVISRGMRMGKISVLSEKDLDDLLQDFSLCCAEFAFKSNKTNSA